MIFAPNQSDLNSIPAQVDSNIAIIQSISNTTEFHLKQFYKISNESFFEDFDTWNIQSGTSTNRKFQSISSARMNLRGALITSSHVQLDKRSTAHLDDFTDKHIDSIMRVNYQLINTMLEPLNVSKKHVFQNTWGYFNKETKMWSGMVGDVIHNGADIGGELDRVFENLFRVEHLKIGF